MTKEELDNLLKDKQASTIENFGVFVYCDKPGIVASIPERYGTPARQFNVEISCPGMITAMGENSITIRWDHYYFEDHTKQELFPNPVTELGFDKLYLIRANKFLPGWSYC